MSEDYSYEGWTIYNNLTLYFSRECKLLSNKKTKQEG